jgi:hypothetical protein
MRRPAAFSSDDPFNHSTREKNHLNTIGKSSVVTVLGAVALAALLRCLRRQGSDSPASMPKPDRIWRRSETR